MPIAFATHVDNPSPFVKNALWVSLQLRIAPNNFLMSAEDISIEKQLNHFVPDVAKQLCSHLLIVKQC